MHHTIDTLMHKQSNENMNKIKLPKLYKIINTGRKNIREQ